jgi:hypothetical protein
VFRKSNHPVQIVEIERDDSHTGWLIGQLGPIRNYVELMDPAKEWIMNDQHVLCSPKWCDHWYGCKGFSVRDDFLSISSPPTKKK